MSKKNKLDAGSIVGFGIPLISLLVALIISFTHPVSFINRLIGLACWTGAGLWLYVIIKDKVSFKSDFIRVASVAVITGGLIALGVAFLFGFWSKIY